jgi:hypothetical protein
MTHDLRHSLQTCCQGNVKGKHFQVRNARDVVTMSGILVEGFSFVEEWLAAWTKHEPIAQITLFAGKLRVCIASLLPHTTLCLLAMRSYNKSFLPNRRVRNKKWLDTKVHALSPAAFRVSLSSNHFLGVSAPLHSGSGIFFVLYCVMKRERERLVMRRSIWSDSFAPLCTISRRTLFRAWIRVLQKYLHPLRTTVTCDTY